MLDINEINNGSLYIWREKHTKYNFLGNTHSYSFHYVAKELDGEMVSQGSFGSGMSAQEILGKSLNLVKEFNITELVNGIPVISNTAVDSDFLDPVVKVEGELESAIRQALN